jgi:hypothetical protein
MSMSDLAMPQPPWGAPLTVGKILERVWVLLKGGWKLYLGLGSLPMGAMLLMEAGVFGVMFAAGVFPKPGTTSMSPERARQMLTTMLPLILLLDLIFLVVYAWFQGAACHAALAANRDRPGTFSEAVSKSWTGVGRYTWLGLLKGLVIGVPAAAALFLVALLLAVFVIQGAGGMSPGAQFLLLPLLLLALVAVPVYAVWMALKLSLAFPACVCEDIPAWESLKRSSFLTQRAKGRIFVVILVVYALNYAVMMAIELVGFLLGFVGSLTGVALHLHWSRLPAIALLAIGGIALVAFIVVLTGLTMSAVAIALCVLYDDQRMRLEPAATGAPATG